MSPRSLYSSEPAKGWMPWGALAPFLCILFVAAPALTADALLAHYDLADAMGDPIGRLGFVAFLFVPFTLTGLVVWAWVRFVERRSLATIGLTRGDRVKRFLHGHAVGLATISSVVGAIWIAGGFTAGEYGRAFCSLKASINIGCLLLGFALQSSVEELLFRGWLFSAVARKFNVTMAVVLTSAVFTLLHYGPKQHWATTLSSFLFSTFACAWALRVGSIWSVMGWHAGWNWLLAVGFEVPVTGMNVDLPALLVSLTPRGSVLLNGGAQGPEGSLACCLFFAAGIAFLFWRMRSSPASPTDSTGQQVGPDRNRAASAT